MEKLAQQEVRDHIRLHIKIKDADLLGEAINEIAAKRTSGKIDPQGRGFKAPDSSESLATIYSSTVILADQVASPRGEYIYTMEEVPFVTEIQVEGKENKFTEKESDVNLTGGWIFQNGEYVLVVFSKKKELHTASTDYEKMQGREFYNAVFTRYVTRSVAEYVLRPRGFSARNTANDYPDLKSAFTIPKQKVINKLRGVKDKNDPPEERSLDDPKAEVKSNSPEFVNKNYYLYDRQSADVIFGHPKPKAPFDPKTDPGINFHFNFPNFVGENNMPADNPNAGDVDVSFSNVPKDMPHEIFGNIFDYLKNGLDAKELSSGTDIVYGNNTYTKDPSEGQETLFQMNSQKTKQLLAEIESLYRDNKEYKVDFDENIPHMNKAAGVRKNILKYLNELEAYVRKLKKNLPLSLSELDRLIEEKGEYAVNPKNVNLLKILKTK